MRNLTIAALLIASQAHAGERACMNKIVGILKNKELKIGLTPGQPRLSLTVPDVPNAKQQDALEEIQDCLASTGRNELDVRNLKTNKLVGCTYRPLSRKWTCTAVEEVGDE